MHVYFKIRDCIWCTNHKCNQTPSLKFCRYRWENSISLNIRLKTVFHFTYISQIGGKPTTDETINSSGRWILSIVNFWLISFLFCVLGIKLMKKLTDLRSIHTVLLFFCFCFSIFMNMEMTVLDCELVYHSWCHGYNLGNNIKQIKHLKVFFTKLHHKIFFTA